MFAFAIPPNLHTTARCIRPQLNGMGVSFHLRFGQQGLLKVLSDPVLKSWGNQSTRSQFLAIAMAVRYSRFKRGLRKSSGKVPCQRLSEHSPKIPPKQKTVVLNLPNIRTTRGKGNGIAAKYKRDALRRLTLNKWDQKKHHNTPSTKEAIGR